LPKGNFKDDQRARMTSWVWAGAEAWVIVLHTRLFDRYSKTGKFWRVVPLRVFNEPLAEGVGSWDLREWPMLTLDEVIRTLTE
jgi:hypothetical protein